jgi:hypothetical protein
MSTKTTFKRVALVAVAALGFGMLSVMPSSAADGTVNEVTAVTIAAPATGRIGSALASAVGFTTAASTATDGVLDTGDEVTLRGIFVSKPTGSIATIIFDNSGLALVGPSAATAVFTAAAGFLPSKLLVDSTTADYTAGAHVAGRVGFVPDVAGDYVIKVWHDVDADGAIGSTEAVSAARTFTVGTAPTAVTVTKFGATTCEDAANGSIVKLTLPAGTGLALGEAIRVSPSTATADITLINGSEAGHTAGAASFVDVIGSQFVAGSAWLNVTDTAAGTLTLSFAGQGTGVAAITGSTTVSYKTCATGDLGTTVIQGATAGAAFTSITDGINGDSTTATIPLAAKTITYYSKFTDGTAAEYYKATVTDSDNRVTGAGTNVSADLVYDIAYVGAANATTATTIEGTFTVTLSPTATGQGFNVTTANGTVLVSGVQTAAVVSSSGSVTVSPAGALALKTGGSLTYTVTAKDQFGRANPNAIVTMTTDGRNSNQTVIAKTATTDALGIATFTITDAPLATTTALLDTWTFIVRGADNTIKSPTTAPTINWSATGPVVGTVTILGGNNTTTTGVAATSPSYKDIAAGATGATGALAPVTATVKDAAGNLLTGVPVTFTVSGTTAAVTSTTQTVYTGAAGTAAANVYAWAVGSYTVTATAGGVAGTAVYAFRQAAAGEERAISATVSGNMVTAKVVDRFGNPVPLVLVYATKSGVGYFGNGTLKTTGSTDNAGEVSFVIAGGAAEVTVATYDIGTDVAPLGSGQTCARAGAADCNVDAADDTAFTASVAGTATVAEKGVGASFAAAGVSSAKVSVAADTSTSDAATAAADAAAEATDAANAATDAANAAAEAADAATAAAQDAADAVAALSTQVSEMVDALKKQITALTNLVIKIQKKVKA